MRRPTTCLLLTLLVACSASRLNAQADAQAAFAAAKQAFGQDDFAAARDLFAKASETDGDNPEVFLWLGKAHYQLGEVEKALSAWQRTLKLAPEQPYADRMLKALRSELTDIDTRIRLIQAVLDEGLYDKVIGEARVLRAAISLTTAQRVEVTLLWCEALLHHGKATEVRDLLRRLKVTDPASADTARTTLLLGWAKLLDGSPNDAAGIAQLKKLIADHPQTPEAAAAELVLIEHDLRLETTLDGVKSLAAWIAAHPDHRRIRDARETLLLAYLQLTTQGPAPDHDATLSESDQAAFGVLASLDAGPGTRIPLVDKVRLHLESQYAARGALAAALSGMEGLSGLRLSSEQRHLVLTAMAKYRAEMVVDELIKAARTGQLAEGPLPESVTEVLALYGKINQQFPAKPAWSQQADLAESVLMVADQLPPSPRRTQVPSPALWAVQIAMPVISAAADTQTVAKATGVVGKVIETAQQLSDPRAGVEQAITLSQQFLDALPDDSPAYREVQLRHADLLDTLCHQVFAENRRLGKVDLNAKLTDRQLALIGVLSDIAKDARGDSQLTFEKLAKHLAPWIRHDHLEVAEQAYAKLGQVLTPAVRRNVDLAVVGLSVDGIYHEHARVTAAGLTVPRELNPELARSLLRLYELQAALDRKDPFLAQIRTVSQGIVTHYRTLEYYDTAEAAIKTAPDQVNDNAQAYAGISTLR